MRVATVLFVVTTAAGSSLAGSETIYTAIPGALKKLAMVDSVSGASSLVTTTPSTLPSFVYTTALSPDGKTLWTITDDGTERLAKLDVLTGAFANIGPTWSGTIGEGVDNTRLEVATDGTIYGINSAGGQFYSIDDQTGDATVIGAAVGNVRDLAFDLAGTLWAIQQTGVTAKLYTIDASTGVATFETDISWSLTGTWLAHGIMVDSQGQFLMFAQGTTGNSQLWSLDSNTGVATWTAGTGYKCSGGDIYTPTAIPLPSAAGLASAGILALAQRRRR